MSSETLQLGLADCTQEQWEDMERTWAKVQTQVGGPVNWAFSARLLAARKLYGYCFREKVQRG